MRRGPVFVPTALAAGGQAHSWPDLGTTAVTPSSSANPPQPPSTTALGPPRLLPPPPHLAPAGHDPAQPHPRPGQTPRLGEAPLGQVTHSCTHRPTRHRRLGLPRRPRRLARYPPAPRLCLRQPLCRTHAGQSHVRDSCDKSGRGQLARPTTTAHRGRDGRRGQSGNGPVRSATDSCPRVGHLERVPRRGGASSLSSPHTSCSSLGDTAS